MAMDAAAGEFFPEHDAAFPQRLAAFRFD